MKVVSALIIGLCAIVAASLLSQGLMGLRTALCIPLKTTLLAGLCVLQRTLRTLTKPSALRTLSPERRACFREKFFRTSLSCNM